MANVALARFYTRSRKFPKMIGRMTDGSRIPGGPYTFTQVGFGGVALLILLMTRTMWSTGGTIFDLVIVAAIAWGTTKVVGYIPMTRRNVLLAFVDAVEAMLKPRGGTYQGRVIKLARPHHVAGKTTVLTSARPEPASDLAIEPVVAKPQPVPAIAAKRRVPALQGAHSHGADRAIHPPISAVERLLQQTKSNTK